MFPAKILMATDGSGEAAPAVEAAVDLANGTGSELQIVHVVPTMLELPYPSVTARERSDAYLEQRRLVGLRLIENQVRRIEELGGSVSASHYREGKPEKEVLRLSRDLDAGLIVTGGQKRPWFERIFGAGFSEIILRRADCPVLVVGREGLQSAKLPS